MVRLTGVLIASVFVAAACATPNGELASADGSATDDVALSDEPVEQADPTPEPTPSEPVTEEQTAAFAAQFASGDVAPILVDVVGDETPEVFVATIESGVSRTVVGSWDGAEYQMIADADGGEAQLITSFSVEDVNGDGRPEVVTAQSSSGLQSSLTLWTVDADSGSLRPLLAVGGCNDGRNTYGVVGAELVDVDEDGIAEIQASCDDSPLPVDAWGTETYVWADGAYKVA